ncbi:hypothetical protein TAL182_CH04007 [Rhizobium sp. TAL182]|nr:hypothetical protein TAL182_CH04007 [Rhizobium sp. TAL182]
MRAIGGERMLQVEAADLRRRRSAAYTVTLQFFSCRACTLLAGLAKSDPHGQFRC